MTPLQTTTTSLVGMTSVQLANTIDVSQFAIPNEQATLLIQIILAVATLIKMFKKENNKPLKKSNYEN